MLDTLILNAEVYDGDGGDPIHAAVGIKDGRIALVGEAPGAGAARETIDAKGLMLSPGFIDSHASTGLGYLRPGAADNKLYQGVSMELIGNCGTSTAPIGPHLDDTMTRLADQIGFPFEWRDLAEYYHKVEDFGLPIHLGSLIGHSTLRGGVMEDWKNLKPEDMDAMLTALHQAMRQGAFGLSSGLIYPPGCYAKTDELIELCKVARQHGGFYASHIRDERDHVEEAVAEALEIGRGAQIPVLISHLKAANKVNWGKIPKIIQYIENFRTEHGVDAIVDVYPYTAVSTKLRAFLPKDFLKDGIQAVSQKLAEPAWRKRGADYLVERDTDFATMTIISEDIPGVVGRTVTDIAADWGLSPAETVCELVRRQPETWMVYDCISETDMDTAILWPDAIICSDSWSYPVNAATDIGNPHPRTYGAFSRFLKRYVFERPLMSYGDAVRKITSKSADFIGLVGRGRIREGYHADILLMDPNQFADNATYQNPRRYSGGVAYLWLDGKITLIRGEIVNAKNGRVLRPDD